MSTFWILLCIFAAKHRARGVAIMRIMGVRPMKTRLIGCAVSILFGACGGSNAPAPVAIAPVPVAAPLPPKHDASGNLLVVYAGDSLTARLCNFTYTAPYQQWQLDTPLAACAINQSADAIIAMRPGIVVIETGFDTPLDTGALAQEIVALEDYGAVVILTTLPPGPQAVAYNAQIKAAAASYGLQLADYYAGIEDPESVPGAVKFDSNLFGQPMMDGPYPTYAGIEIMWDVVCAFLGPDHGEGQ